MNPTNPSGQSHSDSSPEDERRVISPWMGRTAREQMAACSTMYVILRAVHHWYVTDLPTLETITGYSTETVRWALSQLVRAKLIESIGYNKGLPWKAHSLHYVPCRNGAKRPELPFFHPVRTGYIVDAKKMGPTSSGLVQIGDHAVRFHTFMVPKAVSWIMGVTGLQYRVIPLPEHVLRKEFGWYSDQTREAERKAKVDPFTIRRLVKTAIPDAYLVTHRFAIRVEFELHRKSLERYEAIFRQTHHGDIIFFVIYESESLYRAIQNLAREKKLPVCPIRWKNQLDLDAALHKLEELRADGIWVPSLYRSSIVAIYAQGTLDSSLHDPPPPGMTSAYFK